MPVKDPDVAFVKSGGPTNTNQNLSLGGDASTIVNGRNFVDNFLHNAFDEVTKAESVTGEYEYRHFYYRNRKTYKVKNVRLSVVADQTSIWSKVEFAKGIVNNGFIEPSIIDENTPPSGISDSDWRIPSATNPINLGDVEAGSTASFWARRKVEVGALISPLEKVTIMILVDPVIATAPPITCPTGQHYDTETEQCVDDPEPPDNTCPEGQHRNENNVCVPNTGEPCPTGQILVNGQCVDEGTPPPPVAELTVSIVGDIGCNNDAEETLFVAGSIVDLNLFIANGDISYSSNPDCFLQILDEQSGDEISLREITKITIGNHDDSEDESARIRQDYISEFGIPSVGYYSFNLQNVHFLMMDTQSNYASNSAQFNFARNDLLAASQSSTIDWIVVCYHKPSITAPSDHGPLTDFRDIYHPLFDQFKVDIVVSSHNHNMQATYPIKYNSSSPSNPTVVSTGETVEGAKIFNNIDGRFFFVSGGGGRALDDIGSVPSYFQFTNDRDFGQLVLSWFNNNKSVVCSFFANTNNTANIEELMHFVIHKP